MSPKDKKREKDEEDASTLDRMEASALRILALRSNTRSELGRKLRQRSFPQNQIEILLDRLEAIGYLNDTEAARNWAVRRIRSRPMGRRLMEQELKRLGLSGTIVENTIKQVYGDDGELECACRAAEKKLKALEGKDKLKDRLLQFLQRRGFSVQICLQAVKDVVERRERFEDENEGRSLETEIIRRL